MRPVGQTHKSLKDLVRSEVRRDILEGAYKPGERLIEEELANRFEVSRMPVRQALADLEVEGLVQNVPRKGASVITLTVEEAMELFEVRGALEGLAARLAAENRPEEELNLLEDFVEKGLAAGSESSEAMPDLHQEFHLSLGRAAGNAYLVELLAPLPTKIEWAYATVIRQRATTSWPEHAEIVEAIRSGDPDRAESVTRKHVASAADEFLAILADHESTGAVPAV